jgi:hypothetical protein
LDIWVVRLFLVTAIFGGGYFWGRLFLGAAIFGGGYLNSLAYEIVFKLITASMMNSSNNSFLAICKKE